MKPLRIIWLNLLTLPGQLVMIVGVLLFVLGVLMAGLPGRIVEQVLLCFAYETGMLKPKQGGGDEPPSPDRG